VRLCVLDGSPVEPVDRVGSPELTDRVADLAHSRQVDASFLERAPRRRGLVTDRVGERQPVLHLPLTEAHRLADGQRHGPTLDEPLHGRLDLRRDPLQLAIPEVEHRHDLPRLGPRALPGDVSQDVDRSS
jgi:hypothetical protein